MLRRILFIGFLPCRMFMSSIDFKGTKALCGMIWPMGKVFMLLSKALSGLLLILRNIYERGYCLCGIMVWFRISV